MPQAGHCDGMYRQDLVCGRISPRRKDSTAVIAHADLMLYGSFWPYHSCNDSYMSA